MDELRRLYIEYLSTIPAGDDQEYYMTMAEFAQWQIEPFLDWLEAGQAEREAESKALFEYLNRGWKRVLGFALTNSEKPV